MDSDKNIKQLLEGMSPLFYSLNDGITFDEYDDGELTESQCWLIANSFANSAKDAQEAAQRLIDSLGAIPALDEREQTARQRAKADVDRKRKEQRGKKKPTSLQGALMAVYVDEIQTYPLEVVKPEALGYRWHEEYGYWEKVGE